MSDAETPVAVTITQKLGAEALGTFVLVFAGAGAAVVSRGDYVATALAFGFALLVMAYAVGHVSGAHCNPAVSVGAAISGRMAWREVAFYVVAQLVGALLAGLALFAVLHGFEDFDSEGNMGQNFFGDESPGEFAVWAALIVEALATFLLVTVTLTITDRRNPNVAVAPLVIGLTLTVIHLATLGMTGTSVNPARSIGVGVFAGGDAVLQLWLFIIAPLLGALAAGLAHPVLFGRAAEPVPGSGLKLSRPRPAADPWAHAQWQTEYPGWRWDPVAQQWVPDPTTAPPTQQQWGQSSTGDTGEDDRTQIRPPE